MTPMITFSGKVRVIKDHMNIFSGPNIYAAIEKALTGVR
jgi:hypothetical protein